VIVVAAAAGATGTATSQARPSSAVVASATACRNRADGILFMPVSSQVSLHGRDWPDLIECGG
jgi:hypothetical protein